MLAWQNALPTSDSIGHKYADETMSDAYAVAIYYADSAMQIAPMPPSSHHTTFEYDASQLRSCFRRAEPQNASAICRHFAVAPPGCTTTHIFETVKISVILLGDVSRSRVRSR